MRNKGFPYVCLVLAILLSGVLAPLAQPSVALGAEPDTPVNQSPSGTSENLTPTLVSSAYHDSDNDTHVSSDWQISTMQNNWELSKLVYQSLDDTSHKESIGIPLGSLGYSVQYWWRVRHRDNTETSAWSAPTSFTTVAPPLAAFTAVPTAVVVNQPVNFTNTSSGGVAPLTYQWNFGDGTPINVEEEPSHPYSSADNYTVSLTVTDAAGGQDTAESLITVSTGLAVDFSADRTAVVVGQTVNFTNTSSGGVAPLTYQWDFGDGSPQGTLRDASHSYAALDTYTVTLTVTDLAANTDSEEKVNYITVSPALVANFEADRTLMALGQSVKFKDLSAGGVGSLTYEWDFNNDNITDSTDQNPSYSYVAAGTYTVVLKVTDAATNAATVTKTDFITVATGLVAQFSAEKTLVAVSQGVQFTDMSGGGVGSLAYQWDFNGDGTWDSTEQNPLHLYDSAGKYTVVLKVTDADANTATMTKTDYITVTAGAVADFLADVTMLIVGQSVQFTDSSGGAIVSWTWDFGDGTAPVTWSDRPGDGRVSHAYAVAGVYTVALTITDSADESYTETKPAYINVFVLPAADFSASATAIVPGEVVAFTNLSSGGIPPLTYAWDFDDDGVIDSTSLNPSHSYSVTGTYTVSLKVTDARGNSTMERRTGYISVSNAIAPHAIPPEGGTIQTADGRIAVTFPEGAVTGEPTLNIDGLSPSAVAKAPDGYKMGSTCFAIEAVDAEGKTIVMFSRMVTVTVKYSDEDLAAAGGNPERLVLAYYNEATGKWNILETTLNRVDRTLSVTTTHFSDWAVLAKKPSGGMASWIWIITGIAAGLAVAVLVGRVVAIERTSRVRQEP